MKVRKSMNVINRGNSKTKDGSVIKAMWDHWVKTMLCRFSVEFFGLQCLPSVVNFKGDTRTYSSQIYFFKKLLFIPHQTLLSNCSRSH